MSIFQHQLKQSIVWRGFYFITLLLVNIFLSRYLKADGVGIIFYLANFYSLLVLVLSFNMDGSFTYFSSSKKIHHNNLALVAVLWTLIISLLTYFFLPFYFSNFDKEIAITYLVNKYGFYYIIGILLINYFTALFYSLGNFFLPNLILGISNLLLIVLIYFNHQSFHNSNAIVNNYFLFIILQGLILAATFFITQKNINNLVLPTSSQFKQLIKYSAIGLTGNIIFFFVYRIDYWFVKEWCTSVGDLGNYIQASKLSQMLLILPQILASSIFPQIARGSEQKEVVKTIFKLFRLFLIFYILLFIILFITGFKLFPFVFGNSFSTMYLPILILLPGIFCLSISTLLSAYFSGINKNKYNVYAALFALMVMLILTFVFKNKYSIQIAAIISSIAYLCEFFYCIYRFLQFEKITFKELFNFSKSDFMWRKV